jgi:hypothetical protein
MIHPADIFIKIEPNVEYVPENGESVIYQLHCLKTNECPVKIWTYNTNTPMEFPPGSFIQGAVYPIIVFKMDFESELASFMGYKNGNNMIPNYMPKGWLMRYKNNKQNQ